MAVSSFHDIVADRVVDQPNNGVQMKLLKDPGSMCFDGPYADGQL
jgi:hypothetical protein